MSLSKNTKDWIAVVLGILGLLVIVGVSLFSVWLRIWGPCEWMGWFPLSEIPTRCTTLKGGS